VSNKMAKVLSAKCKAPSTKYSFAWLLGCFFQILVKESNGSFRRVLGVVTGETVSLASVQLDLVREALVFIKLLQLVRLVNFDGFVVFAVQNECWGHLLDKAHQRGGQAAKVLDHGADARILGSC